MNNILQKIDEAKHIVIVLHVSPTADLLGSASAFYTHLLRLHKKVSFFCSDNIDRNLLFIPWSDKIRSSFPSSADLAISFNIPTEINLDLQFECDLIDISNSSKNNFTSTTELIYDFYKENSISINPKMATALYSGLLDESNGFTDDKVNGTIFAIAKELIECGADYKLCNKFIMKYITLCAFRLKAIMYKNMQLHNDAKVAFICLSDDEMKLCGANKKDTECVLEESLHLPTVEIAIVLIQNSDYSIDCMAITNDGVDIMKIFSKHNAFVDSKRVKFKVDNGTTLENLKIEILKLIYKEI